MNQNPKRLKNVPKKTLPIVLIFLVCLVLLLLAGNLYFSSQKTEKNGAEAAASGQPDTEAPDGAFNQGETRVEDPAYEQDASDDLPEEEKKTILPQLEAYYDQNPELAGWITIEGTELDYPFMYTPDEPEKYLHLDLEGNYSSGGTIFVDANCSLDPESDNLIFHGHNMRDGSMFRTLLSYQQEMFWQEHPVIQLSTLYEEREYEILAAFYDRVYYADETCFKFYQFIDAADEAEYNEAIDYYKENALYDTGVTAQYGDRLITLSTCSYHVANGRFVVVAREITENGAE